jgi:outer membrane protein OmpA-like peptidoglycan-associated protein
MAFALYQRVKALDQVIQIRNETDFSLTVFGVFMKTTLRQSFGLVLSLALAMGLLSMAYAQDASKIIQVPIGQRMNIEGVILSHQSGTMMVRSFSDVFYNVVVSENTQLKEKKSNPFRGAKNYSRSELVPGLRVEIKGDGVTSGAIAAKEIRFKNDDFVVAQAMDVRVVPVENNLKETQTRLGETEQNAQRLSGQVQELSAVSNAARGGAKAAQDTADSALNTATNAQSSADKARVGVRVTNERITLLDDFDIKGTTAVYFQVGSALLATENKSELEKFAGLVGGEKGFVIEVAGFASSDGDEAYNRILSQKRADAVIQYLAENYRIPLRRFVTPMGYGESQPVADNSTRAGRKENRRVEVRLLVSKGLNVPAGNTSATNLE